MAPVSWPRMRDDIVTERNAIRNGAGTLADRVGDTLRRAILAGEFAPGDKLPSEAQLTRAHGVSRTVVRRAIAALRADGLVEAHQGAGVFVLDPIRFAFEHGRPTVDRARLYSALEALEVRIPLEVTAAGLAAQRRSPAQEEEIFACHSGVIACLDAGLSWTMADRALHLAIARATNNPRFSRSLELQGASMIPQTGQLAEDDAGSELAYRRLLIKEHERIVLAISGGDAEAAREAMRDHLTGSEERHRNLLRSTSVRTGAP